MKSFNRVEGSHTVSAFRTDVPMVFSLEEADESIGEPSDRVNTMKLRQLNFGLFSQLLDMKTDAEKLRQCFQLTKEELYVLAAIHSSGLQPYQCIGPRP